MADPAVAVPVTQSFQGLSQAIQALSQAASVPIAPLQNLVAAFGRLASGITPVASAIAGVGQTLGSAVSSCGNALTSVGSVLNGLGKQLAKVGGDMGRVGSVFAQAGGIMGQVGGVVGAVGGAMGAVAGVASAVIGGIGGIVTTMASLVQVASPAVFQLFTNAVQDMMGVMGQALTPVFQVVTTMIRIAADSLASWAPQLGAVVGAMASAFIPFGRVLYEIFGKIGQAIVLIFQAAEPAIEAFGAIATVLLEAVTPIIETVVQLVGGVLAGAMQLLSRAVLFVTPYIMAFAHILQDVFEWVASAVKELLALAGIALPEFEKPKEGASVGAAAKSTNIGSVESVIQSAMKSAFSLGTAAKDPTKEAVVMLGDLKGTADKIHEKIVKLPQDIWEKLPKWVQNTLNEIFAVVQRLVEAGKEARLALAERAGTGVRETGVGIVPTGGPMPAALDPRLMPPPPAGAVGH